MTFALALLPTAGVLFIFWLGIKSLVEADRRERAAQARWETVARRASAGSDRDVDPAEGKAGPPGPPGPPAGPA